LSNENDLYQKMAAIRRLPGSKHVIRFMKNAITLDLIRPPEHIPLGGSMDQTAKKSRDNSYLVKS
jgi:hypothetical protein